VLTEARKTDLIVIAERTKLKNNPVIDQDIQQPRTVHEIMKEDIPVKIEVKQNSGLSRDDVLSLIREAIPIQHVKPVTKFKLINGMYCRVN
jgi:hypothetical protein